MVERRDVVGRILSSLASPPSNPIKSSRTIKRWRRHFSSVFAMLYFIILCSGKLHAATKLVWSGLSRRLIRAEMAIENSLTLDGSHHQQQHKKRKKKRRRETTFDHFVNNVLCEALHVHLCTLASSSRGK